MSRWGLGFSSSPDGLCSMCRALQAGVGGEGCSLSPSAEGKLGTLENRPRGGKCFRYIMCDFSM